MHEKVMHLLCSSKTLMYAPAALHQLSLCDVYDVLVLSYTYNVYHTLNRKAAFVSADSRRDSGSVYSTVR